MTPGGKLVGVEFHPRAPCSSRLGGRLGQHVLPCEGQQEALALNPPSSLSCVTWGNHFTFVHLGFLTFDGDLTHFVEFQSSLWIHVQCPAQCPIVRGIP